MKLLLFAAALLLLAPAADTMAGDSCAPVDMRTGDGAMAGTTSMTQGKYGICYAYTASEMADAWNRSHLPKPRSSEVDANLPSSSPVAIALESSSATHSEKPLTGGGSTAGALTHIRENPPCDYKAAFGSTKIKLTPSGKSAVLDLMPADISNMAPGGRDQAYLDLLLDSWEEYKRKIKSPLLATSNDQFATEAAHRLACRLSDGRQPLPEGLANDVDGALAEVFSDAAKDGATQQDFLNAYFKAACANHRIAASPPMPAPKLDDFKYQKHSVSGVVSSISNQLNSAEPQPVAITYCSSILAQPGEFQGLAGESATVDGKKSYCNGTAGAHASVVIGRKPGPDGSCKFLVRNSWGAGCERYKKSGWECDEATGDIWVDSEKLAGATFEVVHF